VATPQIISEFFGSASSVLRRPPPNQSLQLTAGRPDASHKIMKAHSLQSTLAPASGS
jgi:hypothetical protein